MLTTLIAAPAQAPAERAWVLSVVLHLGLIVIALQCPRPAGDERADPRGRAQVLFWPVPPHGALVRAIVPPPLPRAPLPLAPPSGVSPALAPVEAPPATAWPTAPADPFPGAPLPAGPAAIGPPSPPVAAPMDVLTVEEPPVLLSHPAPGYPELLRRAGIPGRVVVEAVVDTAGRVERGSLRIVSSTQALFVPEASALVLGSRYRPARYGGKAVRVRVQVPVDFVVRW